MYCSSRYWNTIIIHLFQLSMNEAENYDGSNKHIWESINNRISLHCNSRYIRNIKWESLHWIDSRNNEHHIFCMCWLVTWRDAGNTLRTKPIWHWWGPHKKYMQCESETPWGQMYWSTNLKWINLEQQHLPTTMIKEL